ncbi:hypothetical protein [Rhodococcus pyridinivorans]|uniref:hypothetical protein n=1 Tax=Rhodococcus pyridinivorans TaxID=103816 RepID=UPI00110ECF1C|nr:hypothetical protein [Rhodococcus pyridinivorans]
MKSTATPASYLVDVVLVDGEERVGHTATFDQAVDRAVTDAAEHLGTNFTSHATDVAVYAIAPDGRTVEYRITPHDRPVPEGEPSVAEVDAAELHADEPIDLTLTETALEMLRKRADESVDAVVIEPDDVRLKNFTDLPTPSWEEYGESSVMNAIANSEWRGPAVDIPLAMHNGEWTRSGGIHQAFARIMLTQKITEFKPRIELERWANHKGKDGLSKADGSRYLLTLDEARQLAHDLLLMLDVASDAPDEGRTN